MVKKIIKIGLVVLLLVICGVLYRGTRLSYLFTLINALLAGLLI